MPKESLKGLRKEELPVPFLSASLLLLLPFCHQSLASIIFVGKGVEVIEETRIV
jgi:hypothetical protein